MRSINLVPHLLVLLAACSPAPASQAPQATADVTVFEGALLITGEDGPPIENSAFIVENGRLTLVGRSGEVPVPAGAARVDLSGKTVMPAMVDIHGHIGYRKYLDNSVENFTRENIEDHLQRLAYHGVTAFLSLGTDRRENAYRIRDELRGNPLPDGARYFTGGQGLARPNAGPGIPMRFAAYAISTPEDARLAVREMALRHADYIKIWVDDRRGRVAKLTPPQYRAAIDEAHKHGLRVMAHTFLLADVKDLLRSGLDGFAHNVWREQGVDDELIEIFKEHPDAFVNDTFWGSRNQIFGGRPEWIDDPLLHETFSPEEIALLERPDTPVDAAEVWADGMVPRSVMKLKEAGVRFAVGSDIGGISGGQFFGWSAHISMASWVEAGLTPAEAIIVATRNSAEALGVDDLGTVAEGKSADFIVLNANPLEDIANTRKIDRVYMRGREIDRAALRAKFQRGWSD